MTQTTSDQKLVADLRTYGGSGFMNTDQYARVPYGFLYRAASTIESLRAERDALRAQLDRMTEQFGWAHKYGGLIIPFTHDSPRPEDQYTTRVRRIVGPWLEVTD